MYKLHLLILLFAIFSTSVSAQSRTGTLTGTVSSEGEPLPGVNVGIEGLQKGSATDNKGIFVITNIPEGTYTLQASAVGYTTFTREIKVKAGATLNIRISLNASTLHLDQVVVTGTMRKTYVKDSPVKVEVVNVKKLTQGKTSSNFMDLVGTVNGLSTQLNCGVCGTNAIRINGVEGPNTAVLIDGMPVMGALASVYGLNGISPSIIDQVEVIKGPQSTLYGTQALGGVVNIITKNPTYTPGFSADMYGRTTTREASLNLAVSPEIGRFKGFVSSDLLRNETYFDQNNDGFNDQPKQSRVALFGKGVLQGKEGEQRISIAAKYLNENRTGGVSAYSDDIRGSSEIYGESIYTRRAELLSEFRPAGLDERLRFQSALTYHSQDSYYGDQLYDATQNIVFSQATWDQPFSERFRLLIGSTLRYEIYNDNTPATSGGADRRFIPGLFTQGELELGDLVLLAGFRVDHHSEHGFVPAPRLSGKYSPGSLTTFRLSGGTGFRIVNVFTEDHAALTGSREVVFTEDLAPERSRSVTASLEQIFPFGTNPLTVNLDAFYTRFSNKIIPDYDQDPNLIVYENLNGFSITRGFSIGLEQNFTALPVSYNANFSLMDVFTVVNGSRRALAYAPDFLGNFGANYRIRNTGISISYSASLVGSKRMPDGYTEQFGRVSRSPVYSTHDVKIAREFSNVNETKGVGFEAYLSAENIFDFSQGSPLVNASSPFSRDFDTIYTWGPLVGRTFSLGLRYNLR